ncbi:unnamed protein product [Fraxinus pennsylvanica]|uniref:Histone-lysine N-methyltransferase, H3 lysine-9 specific SUVH1 n=1 Tax=Fraxinus pennsylvanica TaxID=56036 RepID=A0AAD2DJW1_9LAMI|nr:unnamed protein product [Fraxinus pennsylvanica]
MDRGLGSDSNPSLGSIDKSRVLDVRPLRCLVPVLPNPPGMSSVSTPQPSPFVCVPPTGPFPPGIHPFYPFSIPNDSQHNRIPHPSGVSNPLGNRAFGNSIPAPVPLNSFRTPTPQSNGGTRQSERGSEPVVLDDDGYSDSLNQSGQHVSGFSVHVDTEDVSNTRKRRGRPRKSRGEIGYNNPGKSRDEHGDIFDVESLVNRFLTSFKLKYFDDVRRANGDKETVDTILLVFDLLRRRLTQLEEVKDMSPGISRRPDLKAASLLMTKGVRTNNTKRIGHVPGVEVGDIFFFRMELCIVGLHTPSMAGIDYMNVKITVDEEPVAVSIVSSGGYDDQGDDGDVLIYSGQGGVQRRDGQMFDQKLERGNLALENSLHRANEVRVIRGIKDIAGSNGKIYVYDGLYKIQESWTEKNNSGCNVFKYKLVRVPGQPEAFTLWKSIQQWKDGTAPRTGVILPDFISGAETQPVTLVNDIDDEKGPAYFTYIRNLKYSKPFSTPKSFSGCQCIGGCQPGHASCPCTQRNEGYLPYSSLGILQTDKPLIYECGATCACPPNCRNRMSQAGPKVRLEIFKTNDRGWGLRSWDFIRAGGFICEYAGDAVDASTLGDIGNEKEINYIFDATRYYEQLEAVHDDSDGSTKVPFPLVISAKINGNEARFMNHSCSPNVFWRPVLRESTNESYLHIAFFAIRHIPPMLLDCKLIPYVQPEQGDRGRKKSVGRHDVLSKKM